jgi:hypothetical protein
MRRTTAATIVEQAKLLYSLLTSSPDSGMIYHAEDVENYFRMLIRHCKITHSISPRFPDKKFTLLSDTFLFSGPPAGRVVILHNKNFILDVLVDIVERRVKVVPLQE